MLSIPIVTEFNGAGIEKARKEFSQLEGAGKKAQFAIKKAAIPAAAALAGVGAALFDATKGAIEDAAAQDLLANNLRKTTNATDMQIEANEDWIATQGRLLGVTDDELRPALTKLAKATGDVRLAQAYASQAMDMAAASGKPLETVTTAITKAMGGNVAALAKLNPEYRSLIKEGADFETVMSLIADTTAGSASKAANTAAGQFKRLGIALAETKESIGAALLPAIEAVLPYLTKFGDWAQKNPNLFLAVAGSLVAVAAAVMAVNVAMALNPFTAIAAGVAVVIVAIASAYAKFEGFRKVVDSLFGAMKFWITNVTIPAVQSLFTVFKIIFNGIAKLWNSTIGKLSFKAPSWIPGIGGKGFDVPNIPMLAQGGIVTSATLAVIGEAGPEAVVPLSRAGEFGMGGGTNVTIHVNGGDPQAVVDALRTYMFRNGSVPIRVSG